jgi:sigma-E factor negative regulatory protein RseA
MQKQERLSILVDGDRADSQVIDGMLCDQLLRDRSLHQQWQRYHLIRDTLQGNLSQHLPVDFAARIAHALESEGKPLYNSVPSGLAAYRATWQRWCAAWAVSLNQLGDLSLAAAVALLLLYGADRYQGSLVTASHHNPSLNPLPLGGEMLPVGYSLSSQQQVLRRQLLSDKVNDYDRLRLQHPEANQTSEEPSSANP